ncbi:MAG: glycosyltransferase family 2 protein [Armatimonadetes bacterium]|nr:glycosyltransferase family 2 protein [Armatimonadota bacterium]
MRSPEQNVSVIIPAYNEGERIGETVRSARALEGVRELIVVDDGSRDDTAQRAEAAGATHVLRSERNEGKGAAMNRGGAASRGDILLFLDGDLGSSAAEAGKLLGPIMNGDADVTLALFPSTGKRGGFGTALKLARWGIRHLTGHTVTAPLSGQRAMRREVMEKIGGFASGYAVETGMTVDLLRAGFRLKEIPTQMTHKVTGRDLAGFRHRGRQLFHISAVLLRKFVQYRGRRR